MSNVKKVKTYSKVNKVINYSALFSDIGTDKQLNKDEDNESASSNSNTNQIVSDNQVPTGAANAKTSRTKKKATKAETAAAAIVAPIEVTEKVEAEAIVTEAPVTNRNSKRKVNTLQTASNIEASPPAATKTTRATKKISTETENKMSLPEAEIEPAVSKKTSVGKKTAAKKNQQKLINKDQEEKESEIATGLAAVAVTEEKHEPEKQQQTEEKETAAKNTIRQKATSAKQKTVKLFETTIDNSGASAFSHQSQQDSSNISPKKTRSFKNKSIGNRSASPTATAIINDDTTNNDFKSFEDHQNENKPLRSNKSNDNSFLGASTEGVMIKSILKQTNGKTINKQQTKDDECQISDQVGVGGAGAAKSKRVVTILEEINYKNDQLATIKCDNKKKHTTSTSTPTQRRRPLKAPQDVSMISKPDSTVE